MSENDVICPFTTDGVCVGQCPSQRERFCIIGEDD